MILLGKNPLFDSPQKNLNDIDNDWVVNNAVQGQAARGEVKNIYKSYDKMERYI